MRYRRYMRYGLGVWHEPWCSQREGGWLLSCSTCFDLLSCGRPAPPIDRGPTPLACLCLTGNTELAINRSFCSVLGISTLQACMLCHMLLPWNLGYRGRGPSVYAQPVGLCYCAVMHVVAAVDHCKSLPSPPHTHSTIQRWPVLTCTTCRRPLRSTTITSMTHGTCPCPRGPRGAPTFLYSSHLRSETRMRHMRDNDKLLCSC
jgi:hypothetical protein